MAEFGKLVLEWLVWESGLSSGWSRRLCEGTDAIYNVRKFQMFGANEWENTYCWPRAVVVVPHYAADGKSCIAYKQGLVLGTD